MRFGLHEGRSQDSPGYLGLCSAQFRHCQINLNGGSTSVSRSPPITANACRRNHATVTRLQVRSRLLPDVVADHAGFFKVAGDMNAYLYTSSRAMHSDILNLLTTSQVGQAPPEVKTTTPSWSPDSHVVQVTNEPYCPVCDDFDHACLIFVLGLVDVAFGCQR